MATPALIQHFQSPWIPTAVTTGVIANLPNPTLASNGIIVVVGWNSSQSVTLPASGITDDKGNTYTAGPAMTTGSNMNQALFYSLNTTAGVKKVTATFSGGNLTSPDLFIAVSEWQNITALNGAGLATENTGSVTAWQATGTLGANGDLIYQLASVNSVTPYNGAAAAPGSGFTLQSADLMDGVIAQSRVATGAVTNPTITAGTAGGYTSVAAAFTSGTQGTAPAAGIRVIRCQHGHFADGAATSLGLQFPATGNLIVKVAHEGGNGTTTAVTDSQSNTWAKAVDVSNGGFASIWYAANASVSGTMTLTVTLNGIPSIGSDHILLDVTGAATSPLDTTNSATGTQSAQGNLSTVTLTPGGQNELVLAVEDQDRETMTGAVADANGHTPNFMEPLFIGQDETGAGGAGTQFNIDAASSVFYNGASTTQITFIYSESAGVNTGVGAWFAAAAAFKAPAAAVDTMVGGFLIS